jgi:hypothetical protein
MLLSLQDGQISDLSFAKQAGHKVQCAITLIE